MKTINEVIELMRNGDYGIGVTNEEEAKKTINVLKDNGFKESSHLKDNLIDTLNSVREGWVVELYTDCTDRIIYTYTNKEDFGSNGERVLGEGILFSSIDFSDAKPKDLLRTLIL